MYMIKKLMFAVLSLCIVCSVDVTASSKRLPESMSFHEAIGLNAAEDIKSAVIVYDEPINDVCADIDAEDINTLTELLWDQNWKLVIAPNPSKVIENNGYYINLYKDKKEFANSQNQIIHTLFADSVIYGGYGELQPKSSAFAYSKNFIWYQAHGDDKKELDNLLTQIYDKYKNSTRALENGDGESIPYMNKNLLPLSGAGDWAIDYIQAAASYNILPYNLTENYWNSISRADFCRLAGRLVAGIYYTGLITSENINEVLAQIAVDLGLKKEFDSAAYTDINEISNDIRLLTALGIVRGTDKQQLKPYENIRREEAAAFFFFICAALNIEPPENNASSLYGDDVSISSWAKDDVYLIQNLGILQGMDNNEFRPNDTLSVEQAITTIVRLHDEFMKMSF